VRRKTIFLCGELRRDMTKNKDLKFFSAKSFREILAADFSERKQRRPSYSVRSYARDLGMNASTLAGAMQGRYGISLATAKQVAERLQLDKKQTQFFIDLVESQHSRASFQKKEATHRLKKHSPTVELENLSPEESDLTIKWFFFAVLEYLTVHRKVESRKQIADALRLSEIDVERAIDLLLKQKLVKRTGSGYERIKKHTMVQSKVPSTLIREFHKQVLDLAKQAIDEQPIANRKYINTVLSFDSAKTAEARSWLETANEEFVSKFSTSPTSDKVYLFGFHLFQLDTGSKPND
jgi:uncharacterized protein (TIGR02147 family)